MRRPKKWFVVLALILSSCTFYTGFYLVPDIPTYTRIGSELNFDVRSCPAGSLMLGNWQNSTPLHDDCPTLFIVGARKGGTTSLYHYVDKHPGFQGIKLNNGPMDGETFYFSYLFKKRSWTDYTSQFPKGIMSGEACVDYISSCETPKRLFVSCGIQAKVVVLLRNPISRFVSNFLMRARLGSYWWHPTGMNTNISEEGVSELRHLREKITSNTPKNRSQIIPLFSPDDWEKMKCTYPPAANIIFDGLYYVFVMNYLCNFPAENILIINSEEFFSNPPRILSQLFDFLRLQPLRHQQLREITSQVFNKGEGITLPHQILSRADREVLNRAYLPFNVALFELLRWDGVSWD